MNLLQMQGYSTLSSSFLEACKISIVYLSSFSLDICFYNCWVM